MHFSLQLAPFAAYPVQAPDLPGVSNAASASVTHHLLEAAWETLVLPQAA